MRVEEPRDREPHGARREGDGDDRTSSAGRYAGLGLQLLASILIFLYAGQWLDRRFGGGGIITVVSVLVGFGTAFYSIYRRLMADQRRDDERRRR